MVTERRSHLAGCGARSRCTVSASLDGGISQSTRRSQHLLCLYPFISTASDGLRGTFTTQPDDEKRSVRTAAGLPIQDSGYRIQDTGYKRTHYQTLYQAINISFSPPRYSTSTTRAFSVKQRGAVPSTRPCEEPAKAAREPGRKRGRTAPAEPPLFVVPPALLLSSPVLVLFPAACSRLSTALTQQHLLLLAALLLTTHYNTTYSLSILLPSKRCCPIPASPLHPPLLLRLLPSYPLG